MSDDMYVRLDPAKMGFRYLGALAPEPQRLISEAFTSLKAKMGSDWESQLANKEVFWLNVWQQNPKGNDAPTELDAPLSSALYDWCRTAVDRYCEPNAILDGFGFVVNPKGSEHQVWHVDYATDCAAVWIPVTPFTEHNATQFITLPENVPAQALERIAEDVDEVDVEALAADADYLTVQQIVAKPMSVLYMGRGTIHRGVANTGGEDRVGFYISVHFIRDYAKNYPYRPPELSEPGVATFDT